MGPIAKDIGWEVLHEMACRAKPKQWGEYITVKSLLKCIRLHHMEHIMKDIANFKINPRTRVMDMGPPPSNKLEYNVLAMRGALYVKSFGANWYDMSMAALRIFAKRNVFV